MQNKVPALIKIIFQLGRWIIYKHEHMVYQLLINTVALGVKLPFILIIGSLFYLHD